MSTSQVQDAVREKYGEIARSVDKGGGCCGPRSCGCDPITSNLYSDAETSGLPSDAVAVSLGCGNPTALIELQPGQTVLDLGSGGYRRTPFRQAGGANGQGVRPRHDR